MSVIFFRISCKITSQKLAYSNKPPYICVNEKGVKGLDPYYYK